MNSDDFNPQFVPGLKEYFFDNSGLKNPVSSINFDGENSEYPASNITDGIDRTYCLLPAVADSVCIKCSLDKERYIVGCNIARDIEGIEDFAIFVSDNPDRQGDPIISGDGRKGKYEASLWDNGFTVQKGKKGKYVFIKINKRQGVQSQINGIDFIFGD